MPLLREVVDSLASPYLRSHSTNPVDWWLFDDEAFDEARRRGVPVFLSVGYAACHWCHVMEHESFEDVAIAQMLNEGFVSIKVDREERPDVDALYMAAAQALNGHGGWPLSAFTTPEGLPFFAGTYFPKVPRLNAASFAQILTAVSDLWANRRDDVLDQSRQLAHAAASAVAPLRHHAFDGLGRSRSDTETLALAIDKLASHFDPEWGGFSGAPKFPRPSFIELALLDFRRRHDEHSARMARVTLNAMARGGIYDHLAGGFARYSTDAHWEVPHFEKMLTDQALLSITYLHAYQLFGEDEYAQVVRETLEFVVTELFDESGGVCSSLDADADGIEGSHVVWTPEQVEAVLVEAGLGDGIDELLTHYCIGEPYDFDGGSIPLLRPGASLRRTARLDASRAALLAARRGRPAPTRDDKIVTEWNAMAIVAFAKGSGALGEERFIQHALGISEALTQRNRRSDGRWWRTAGGPTLAFAQDYAWLVLAKLSLYQALGRADLLEDACDLAEQLLALFIDPRSGALSSAGSDASALFASGEELFDSATPAAASVAFDCLSKLASLSMQSRFLDAAEGIARRGRVVLQEGPLSSPDLLAALVNHHDRREVVITGERGDLVSVLRRHYLPEVVVAFGDEDASPLFATRSPDLAYVCLAGSCSAPLRGGDELESALGTPLERRLGE